jgi:hypothetical protein
MQHYFSDAFAFSSSAHTAHAASTKSMDSLHVGSGSPNFIPFYRKDEDENLHSSCSSVCSAASTVASAVFSIGDSISFPVSSDTTFDLTTRLNFEFSSERELAPARNQRTCNSNRGWKRSAHDTERECRPAGSSLLEYVAKKRCHESSRTLGDSASALLVQANDSGLEEFSLGSGSPFASGDCFPSNSFQ